MRRRYLSRKNKWAGLVGVDRFGGQHGEQMDQAAGVQRLCESGRAVVHFQMPVTLMAPTTKINPGRRSPAGHQPR